MNPKELQQKWRGNLLYTEKLLDAVPDGQWDLKPAEGTKTLLGQSSHVVGWLRTHSRFVTGREMKKMPLKTPEEVLAALRDFTEQLLAYLKTASAEELAEPVKVFYGKRSREFVLAVMDNHLAHHRGQMIVYLRLLGVVPPGYRGW